ncbi:MAG: hypothetical protein ACTSPB_24165 [Candidatus Thorarchaeota archaeon]
MYTVDVDVTRQVVEQLRRFPELALFFDTHFIVKDKVSIVPVFTREGMTFPKYSVIARRNITFIDKIKYYILDFILYVKYLRKMK